MVEAHLILEPQRSRSCRAGSVAHLGVGTRITSAWPTTAPPTPR